MKKIIRMMTIVSTMVVTTPSFALDEVEDMVNRTDIPLEIKGVKLSGVVQGEIRTNLASNSKIKLTPVVAINLTLNGRYDFFKDTKFIFKLASKATRKDGLGYHQTYLGFEGKFGTIYVGKVFSESLPILDELAMDEFSTIGANYRYTNSITYKSPSFHGFKGIAQTTINSSDMNALDLSVTYDCTEKLFLSVGAIKGRNEKYRTESFYNPIHVFGQKHNSISKKTGTPAVIDENYRITTNLAYSVAKYTVKFDKDNSLYFILGYKHNNYNTNTSDFKEISFDQLALRVGYNFAKIYEISAGYLYHTQGKGKKADGTSSYKTPPVKGLFLDFEVDLGKKRSWSINTQYLFWNKETMDKSPLGTIRDLNTTKYSSYLGISTTFTISF